MIAPLPAEDRATIKVLSCIAAPFWGGLHVVVERTTPHYIEFGVTRWLALPIADDRMRNRLTAAGANLLEWRPGRPRKTLNPLINLRYLMRFRADVVALRHHIRDHEIDIIEVAGLLNFQPVLAAWCEGKPIVWQLHSTLAPTPLRIVIGNLVKRLAAVVMTSGEGMITRHGGLSGCKVPMVPFAAPIDLARFRADPALRSRARAAMGFADDDFVVGTLGNRGWQKRHEYIVTVADMLRARPIKFAITGSKVETNNAYYTKRVLNEITRLKLDKTVSIIDQSDEAQVIMNAFDVFILPSISEGVSLVTAEALACSIPVVASNVGSIPDLVDDSVGALCDVNDAAAFARGIERMWSDPNIMRRGALCRARAEERAGDLRCAEDHIRAYHLALGVRSKMTKQVPMSHPHDRDRWSRESE
ncbi:glycosyltransferase [Sphingomonas faeni]|uniref:glycosyltransferase n=1 Tax=Sphingomonas faeni TaxID=185950 RepID=UPI0020C80081|nr:glycosyltransferase [Sphingomonas faeni]MCP8890322.1 glycosyltransferase [Sphingomonas faeni]